MNKLKHVLKFAILSAAIGCTMGVCVQAQNKASLNIKSSCSGSGCSSPTPNTTTYQWRIALNDYSCSITPGTQNDLYCANQPYSGYIEGTEELIFDLVSDWTRTNTITTVDRNGHVTVSQYTVPIHSDATDIIASYGCVYPGAVKWTVGAVQGNGGQGPYFPLSFYYEQIGYGNYFQGTANINPSGTFSNVQCSNSDGNDLCEVSCF